MKSGSILSIAGTGILGLCALGLSEFGLGAIPAVGREATLAMLSELEPGHWALRPRGSARDEERVCIGSGRDFVQLRHPGIACRQVVVADRPSEVTVQYTCPGQGYGRTTIRRETDGLIQIDTQGIHGGLPFAFSAEGRRLGPCTR
ncbi:hypothetical protein MTR62_19500 [Novosphingobium sp. 1949]|uniref:DUF3617 family protein n=1 Tax=Novosphingobium organovorum TaxID=2930092 RepID=A0ABT0BIH5_9SPHN|nr:hypothetical protein [Novosphingobium organovorum]MCJ2184858.1 hypothetical protein [Novosphingobium organovorum]